MIYMAIKELHCTFADFFLNWNFHIILISPKGTAKLRWAEWGAEDIIYFSVPRSSIGCSVAQ